MADNELLDIVDKDDKVIGVDTKENKFKKCLISRNIAIFILTKDNKFLIPRRSKDKRTFPNYLDIVAGNVMSGESYSDAATREIFEELGIKPKLDLIKKYYHEFHDRGMLLKYFTAVFIGKHIGEVKINEEFSEVKIFSLDEIEHMIAENKDQFTPGLIDDINTIKDTLKRYIKEK